MEVNGNSALQDRENIDYEKHYVISDPNLMTGIDKKNVIVPQLIVELRNRDLLKRFLQNAVGCGGYVNAGSGVDRNQFGILSSIRKLRP